MVELLKITADETKRVVKLPGGPVEIERHRNDMQLITGYLQPMVPINGVTPVGELEVLDCLGDDDYVVVDMRDPDWRLKGTIPGSISIPFGEVADRLDALGCVRTSSGWNCDAAKKVVAFCNGPACPQSSIAMHAMVDSGFPPEKIYYYRGGMQDWLVLGLTTQASAAWPRAAVLSGSPPRRFWQSQWAALIGLTSRPIRQTRRFAAPEWFGSALGRASPGTNRNMTRT